MDTWELIATERARLVEALATLTEAQWTTPSLCAGWTTKDTLAHIVSTAEMTPPKFVLGLAGSGFSFGRLMARNVATVGADPVPQLLERLRARVHARNAPPGPTGSWLVETVAHGEDIAYPTSTTIAHSEEALVRRRRLGQGHPAAARRQEAHRRAAPGGRRRRVEHRRRPRGPRPLRTLILAMVGRPPVLDDLRGDGVAELRARSGQQVPS